MWHLGSHPQQNNNRSDPNPKSFCKYARRTALYICRLDDNSCCFGGCDQLTKKHVYHIIKDIVDKHCRGSHDNAFAYLCFKFPEVLSHHLFTGTGFQRSSAVLVHRLLAVNQWQHLQQSEGLVRGPRLEQQLPIALVPEPGVHLRQCLGEPSACARHRSARPSQPSCGPDEYNLRGLHRRQRPAGVVGPGVHGLLDHHGERLSSDCVGSASSDRRMR